MQPIWCSRWKRRNGKAVSQKPCTGRSRCRNSSSSTRTDTCRSAAAGQSVLPGRGEAVRERLSDPDVQSNVRQLGPGLRRRRSPDRRHARPRPASRHGRADHGRKLPAEGQAASWDHGTTKEPGKRNRLIGLARGGSDLLRRFDGKVGQLFTGVDICNTHWWSPISGRGC